VWAVTPAEAETMTALPTIKRFCGKPLKAMARFGLPERHARQFILLGYSEVYYEVGA
jgi:hypothetical protein